MWTVVRLAGAPLHDGKMGGLTELDNITNCAHDQETDTNSLADLDKFLSVSCREHYVSNLSHLSYKTIKGLTLLASVDELHAILQEVAWHIEEFLDLVRHCERCGVWEWIAAQKGG